MLTDWAVALSTSPICSAMCMKRLLDISMRAGSAAAVARASAAPGADSSSSSPPASRLAAQPLSSTTVLCGSTMRAGPASGPRSSLIDTSGTSRQPSNQARALRGRAAALRGHDEPRRIERCQARLGAQRLDDDVEAVRREAEALQMLGVEALAHLGERAERHGQCHVAVARAHLEQQRHPYAPRPGTERGELIAGLRLEQRERLPRRS